MYLKGFSIIIMLCMLSGCGTIAEYHELQDDAMVLVAQLKLNKPGAVKVEKEGVKMEMDTRAPNIWEQNVVPIFQGAVKNTQASL